MGAFNQRARPRHHVSPRTHTYLGKTEFEDDEIRGMSHEAFHDYALAEARQNTLDATHHVCTECGARFDA